MFDMLEYIDSHFGEGLYDKDIARKAALARCLGAGVQHLSDLQQEALRFSERFWGGESNEDKRIKLIEDLFGEENKENVNFGANRIAISSINTNDGMTSNMVEYLVEWSEAAGMAQADIKRCIDLTLKL